MTKTNMLFTGKSRKSSEKKSHSKKTLVPNPASPEEIGQYKEVVEKIGREEVTGFFIASYTGEKGERMIGKISNTNIDYIFTCVMRSLDLTPEEVLTYLLQMKLKDKIKDGLLEITTDD